MADIRSVRELPDVIDQILECVKAGMTDVPQRAYPAPGAEVAWDCEQLWVRFVNAGPTPNSAVRNAAVRRPCGPASWTVVLAVGILRCVAVVNDQGQPPSPSQLAADGAQMLRDFEEMRLALACCEEYPLTMGMYTPFGPDGGYAGGEWQVSLLMSN